MTELLLIRHGRTPWNECERIQGHRDIGLSAAGRAQLAEARIPAQYAHFRWYASPLARAVQTAELLGATGLRTDERLAELNWGEWEGWTRDQLRARHGAAFAANEARGLDFRPPGGESPGELRVRLRAWIADIAASREAVTAVTHKGVIQMALSLATGWDLVSRPPQRLDWRCGHLFRVVRATSQLRIVRLNIALTTPDTAVDDARGEVHR